MGCDIHCYLEDCYEDREGKKHWSLWAEIHPGRNYTMFEAMAGVRGDPTNAPFPQRGLPADISYGVRLHSHLMIDDGRTGCSMADAERWAKHGNKFWPSDTNRQMIEHPDWHSYSWLTVSELKEVMDRYLHLRIKEVEENEQMRKEMMERNPELPSDFWIAEKPATIDGNYLAIVKVMEALEAGGSQVRLVFWFDN